MKIRTLLAAALLAGCGAIPPRVNVSPYTTITAGAGDDRRGYLFRQRRSVLVVEHDEQGRFQVAPAPWELTPENRYAPLYTIAGADDLTSTTTLKVSYLDNTKFVDEIHVATKDNVADTIGRIADTVKMAIPILASAQPAAKSAGFNPTKIDPMAADSAQWRRDPLNNGYCLRLRNATVESDLTLEAFVAGAGGSWVRSFPVPACATGIVDIGKCTANLDDTRADVSIRVNYAHHANVVPVPLPSTGAIRMHTVCGASVTHADKQDRSDVIDHLRSMIKQIGEIQSAWESKERRR